MKFFLSVSLISAAVLFNACDSSCCQNVVLTKSVEIKGNQTPVPVITGVPVEVACGEKITADGTQSYDPDGQILQYSWTVDNLENGQFDAFSLTLPCDNQPHNICLKVTDNKNASQEVCQSVTVVENKPPVKETACDLVPKITFEKADEMQYKFYCNQSTYNGNPIDQQTSNKCQWLAKKTFTDGTSQDIHGLKGPVKWINIDPEIFKSMDLTLTVKNEQCEKTITEHYLLPQDLPY